MDYNDSHRYCCSINFGYILLDLICAYEAADRLCPISVVLNVDGM